MMSGNWAWQKPYKVDGIFISITIRFVDARIVCFMEVRVALILMLYISEESEPKILTSNQHILVHSRLFDISSKMDMSRTIIQWLVV